MLIFLSTSAWARVISPNIISAANCGFLGGRYLLTELGVLSLALFYVHLQEY